MSYGKCYDNHISQPSKTLMVESSNVSHVFVSSIRRNEENGPPPTHRNDFLNTMDYPLSTIHYPTCSLDLTSNNLLLNACFGVAKWYEKICWSSCRNFWKTRIDENYLWSCIPKLLYPAYKSYIRAYVSSVGFQILNNCQIQFTTFLRLCIYVIWCICNI